jgi:hypothetical protein
MVFAEKQVYSPTVGDIALFTFSALGLIAGIVFGFAARPQWARTVVVDRLQRNVTENAVPLAIAALVLSAAIKFAAVIDPRISPIAAAGASALFNDFLGIAVMGYAGLLLALSLRHGREQAKFNALQKRLRPSTRRRSEPA